MPGYIFPPEQKTLYNGGNYCLVKYYIMIYAIISFASFYRTKWFCIKACCLSLVAAQWLLISPGTCCIICGYCSLFAFSSPGRCLTDQGVKKLFKNEIFVSHVAVGENTNRGESFPCRLVKHQPRRSAEGGD
jgi:hypothetical protein